MRRREKSSVEGGYSMTHSSNAVTEPESLADKVIEASRKNPDRDDGYDELGIIISNKSEYYVARALRINYLNRMFGEEPDESAMLHTRNNGEELWLGHKYLTYSPRTIYSLIKINKSLQMWQLAEIWDLLLKYAPPLDESKILIDPHTYWDIEKGELCHTDEYLEGVD